MKRVFLFAAVLLIAISILPGCGKNKISHTDDASKDVTLRWVIPFSKQADFNKVEKEINTLLSPLLPNTTLELVLDPSMGDKWSLWMSGKTSFDLAHSGYSNDLQSEIMKNSFLSLNDLVEQYAPTVKSEMEGVYNTIYLTGMNKEQLYAIPNIQYHIHETVIIKLSKELEQYFDIDAIVTAGHASPKTTGALYKALDEGIAKANEAAGKNGKTKVNIDISRLYDCIAKRGYIFIGGRGSNLCYDPYADKSEVIDFYQTEGFKTHIKYAQKWYANGNIAKDILTGEFGDVSGGQIVPVSGSRINVNERSIWSGTIDNREELHISIDKPENDILGAHDIGSLATYTSIPFTAKNPARAMQLLELLRTEKGAPLLNLITYGIEGTKGEDGKHYKKVSDNEIETFDYVGQGTSGSKYGIPNWLVGNMFNQYICNPPYSKDTVSYGKNYYENYLPKVKRTALTGFCFDVQPVKNQMAQILSVDKEFEPQLAYGVLSDYNSTYDTLLSRNKTAGIEAVITEFQKQADDYSAKK